MKKEITKNNSKKTTKRKKLFCKENFNNIPFIDSAHFEINSNKEIIIDGCKCILEYDENFIKIKMDKMDVLFFGEKMEIKCMTTDSLVIKGIIASIEFTTGVK